MLHITNGDLAAGMLRAAGVPGEILPWRDVLHEGPVLGGFPLASLSELRARFIADCGFEDFDTALSSFRERDERLRTCLDDDEIVLWFEADLYDQLQLLQVLDALVTEAPGAGPVTLVEVDGYFGHMTPADMPGLFEDRRPVSSEHKELGCRAWEAFRSEQPGDLQVLTQEDTSALPYLAAAIARHFEEYPGCDDGLTRTERQILGPLGGGPKTPVELFKATLAAEQRLFLGDAGFAMLLRGLAAEPSPLVVRADGDQWPEASAPRRDAFWRAPIILSEAGVAVFNGKADWMALSGRSLWRGGVLVDEANNWRFDPSTGGLRMMV